MKKIALFGGAFNPIHLGHIHLAQMLDVRIKFNEIILIPSRLPPHKNPGELASGEHRLNMCRLVAEQHEKFIVSDLEMKREGKSYTVDTAMGLRALYPEDKLYMIVGSDMFLSLETWRSWEELLRLVTVCAAARGPGEYDELIKKQIKLDTKNVKSIVAATQPLNISSTAVRKAVSEGRPTDAMLPPYVAEYIRQHGLYR